MLYVKYISVFKKEAESEKSSIKKRKTTLSTSCVPGIVLITLHI